MKKISFGKISANFSQNAQKIEATGSIGTFGPPKAIQVLEDDGEAQQIKDVMGISSFGKKAKSFDIQEMIAQVKATAKELTSHKPSSDTTDTSESEESDDMIGPPIPETVTQNNSDSLNDEKEDSDTDLGDELFIPCSEEAQMTHGTKAVTALCVDPSGARLASGNIFQHENNNCLYK